MKNKSATRYFSSKQEKTVAKRVGGKTTANSGATKFSKGDVSADDWLIECKTKTTPSKSITVQREWIEKNEEEAFSMGKSHSAVCFSFGDLHNDQNYYILNEKTFIEFLHLQRKSDE